MEYISVEEFLKQSEKIQETLINWWKPQSLDLVCWKRTKHETMLRSDGLNSIENIKNDFIPLFTEWQLREFIEDKAQGRLFNWFDGREVHLYIGYFDTNTVYNTKKLLQTNTFDLLQSYWQVACKIANEIINKER